MIAPLPESWDDEPWPLDDPDTTYGRPVNLSDTHATVPQVADLADEAQELVDQYGWSMERALVEAQRQHSGGLTTTVSISVDMSGFQEAMERVAAAFGAIDERTIEDLKRAVLAMANQPPDTGTLRPSGRRHPSCPTHGLLAKGGFCRRCAARGSRR